MVWQSEKKFKIKSIRNLIEFYHIKNSKTDIKNMVKT